MKLSIVIPVYNEKETIRRAVKSIQKQNYCDYELIIGDNNSDDGTKDILNEIEKEDDRIKVLYNKINIGTLENIKLLKCETTGIFTSLLGAHDAFEDNYFCNFIETVKKNPNGVLYYPKCRYYCTNSKKYSKRYSNIETKELSRHEGMVKVVNNLVKCGNIYGFIKSDLFKILPIEKIYGPDDLILFWLASKGKIHEIDCTGITMEKPRLEENSCERLQRYKKEGIIENKLELLPSLQRKITGEVHLRYLHKDKNLTLDEKKWVEKELIKTYLKRYNCSVKPIVDS